MSLIPAMLARGLAFSYAPNELVFRSLTLTVAPGEVVAIMAGPGAGKTTLLRLCGADLPLQQGILRVLGQDVKSLDRSQRYALRKSIGFISRGGAQDATIERALAPKPALLLADEPTDSLDDVGKNAIRDVLSDAARVDACAVLMATRDYGLLEIADRVLHLVDGALVEMQPWNFQRYEAPRRV